ncbi:MAG: serine hydrolase, partial [Stackebrandtia sp.]
VPSTRFNPLDAYMRRRSFLGGFAAVSGGLVVAGGGVPAAARQTADGPPTVTPDDIVFPSPPPTLRPGSSHQAGLVRTHVEKIVPAAAEYMEPGPGRPNPSHPGFVLLAARNGVIVEHAAQGHALRYESWDADAGTPVELPEDEWVPMDLDTIFDMASVSKLFTSVVMVQLAESGQVNLSAPVTDYVPEFDSADPDKSGIVVEQLLTHSAGQVPFIKLYDLPDDEARMQAIYEEPLEFAPGTSYVYSDLNLIVAAKIIEGVTGKSLDEAVADGITGPLGMSETMYNPPESLWDRVAATEYQPWTDRGMIRGSVHDENAWSFGGVAGHAGVFSTARDLAVFGQMVLNGGVYDGARILGEEWVRSMLTNRNPDFGGSAARGLGWQLDQRFFMDAMTSPVTTGHTGYTGTCITADPLSGSLFVLLTNRVHPTRDWGAISDYRRAPSRHFARAVPVKPARGLKCWYSGQADAGEAVMTVPLDRFVAEGRATFRLWYDTESTDVCTLESLVDDEWTATPMTLSAGRHSWETDGAFSGFSTRRWLEVETELPEGASALRWRYVADDIQQGRGIYVDDIRVYDGPRLIFLSLRPRDNDKIVAEGWSEEKN